MPTRLIEQPVYLAGGVSGILHELSEGSAGSCVVLCPPTGWAEVSSYRARRQWAIALASAGHPTLRLALPSTGDSLGTPHDPDRFGAWTTAVRDAAAWLRRATGRERAAAIGIGVGGILALESGSFDDLVLWAVPARGRTLVREQQALASLEADRQFPQGRPAAEPEGALVSGGFLLTGETLEALRGWSLEPDSLPARRPARALLLERDGLPADERLSGVLEASGVAVTRAGGDGYGAMFSHPQQAALPQPVLATVERWLAETTNAPRSLVAASSAADGSLDGQDFRERAITLDTSLGAVRGVITEPLGRAVEGPTLVLLNAGAIYHIGPARMWVELARRWSPRGLRTVRLDLSGIGDADGPWSAYRADRDLYVPELSEQALEVLDALAARDLGERFLIGGLCSGAYWAFHSALRDPRVSAAYMLNPAALFWRDTLLPSRDFRRGVLRPANWHRARALPRTRYAQLARYLITSPVRAAASLQHHPANGHAGRDSVPAALDALHAADKRVLMLFSEHEPLHEELVAAGHLTRRERWPNLTLELVPGYDHALRPLVAQRAAHAALDRVLAAEWSPPEGGTAAQTGVAT